MKKLTTLLLLTILLAPAGVTHAQTGTDARNTSIYSSGLRDAVDTAFASDPPEANALDIVTTIVSAVLGLLGVAFFILMIYAGVLWMTAAGNPDSVKKAKQILSNSVIGIVIVLSAYAISKTVVSYISTNIY